MNKQEAKILHGIYYHRELVGEETLYSAAELNWLIKSSYAEGKNWVGEDGRLKALELPVDDWLSRHGMTSAAAERPLAYLREHGYLDYQNGNGLFRVKITGRGADAARELATKYGRLNLIYKKHKDGLLWLVATVLVSAITTLVTQSCKPKAGPAPSNPALNLTPPASPPAPSQQSAASDPPSAQVQAFLGNSNC